VSNLMRLLDLPDEALDLIERGELTEGHGRALLLAAEHADRRRLARDAAAGEWSVRVTETRAREAGGAAGTGARTAARTGARTGLHPDQAEAAERIAETLGAVLGTEVLVRPAAGGYRAELRFADPEEAVALARRLGPRRVA
jgi:ParB family chromosome partitioning protein